MIDTPSPTIAQTAIKFLDSVNVTRNENTTRAYSNGMSTFLRVLEAHGEHAETIPASQLKEEAVAWLMDYLKDLSPATEKLYLHIVMAFYEYLAAERFASVNFPRLRLLLRQKTRHSVIRRIEVPTNAINRVLDFMIDDINFPTAGALNNLYEDLRFLRDRAFLLTLADTGLRVHEACELKHGDVDLDEERAVIFENKHKQEVVRFSSRSIRALRDYLALRAPLDGRSGKQLSALPLFARHDKGAGKKIKPITTATGRSIVRERVRQALGAEAEGHITPHSFRHYFVTAVLRGSGNLKLAQALARHANIQVTQRYAHLSDDELDRGYHEIFESPQKKD